MIAWDNCKERISYHFFRTNQRKANVKYIYELCMKWTIWTDVIFTFWLATTVKYKALWDSSPLTNCQTIFFDNFQQYHSHPVKDKKAQNHKLKVAYQRERTNPPMLRFHCGSISHRNQILPLMGTDYFPNSTMKRNYGTVFKTNLFTNSKFIDLLLFVLNGQLLKTGQ